MVDVNIKSTKQILVSSTDKQHALLIQKGWLMDLPICFLVNMFRFLLYFDRIILYFTVSY